MAATKSTCGGCGEIFASVATFDAHRVGSFGEPIYQTSRTGRSRSVVGHTPRSRRCLTCQEMHGLGMVQNEKGWWMLPSTANPQHEADEEGWELFAR
jgi:hypothetical protein